MLLSTPLSLRADRHLEQVCLLVIKSAADRTVDSAEIELGVPSCCTSTVKVTGDIGLIPSQRASPRREILQGLSAQFRPTEMASSCSSQEKDEPTGNGSVMSRFAIWARSWTMWKR